jgi:tetratricopeptide (TPR) repeat protein
MSQPFTALNIARYSHSLEGCDAVLEELGGDPERGSFMINGASPLAFHHGARAVALTHLGRCAEARESISAARSVADHHIATTLAWTHIYNFWSMEIGRDFPTADVLRDAEDALALSDEIGDVFTRSNTYLCGGGVIALSGDLHRAIDLYDAAVEMFTATGVVRNTEMYLAMLRGSALCRIGDVDAGLAQAKHAVDLADRYGLSLLAITARTSYAECLLASADGPGIVEATRQLREAERLLVGSESEIDRIDVLRVRAQLHNVNGEPERGEMEHAKAVDFARAADARGLLAVLGEPVATSG